MYTWAVTHIQAVGSRCAADMREKVGDPARACDSGIMAANPADAGSLRQTCSLLRLTLMLWWGGRCQDRMRQICAEQYSRARSSGLDADPCCSAAPLHPHARVPLTDHERVTQDVHDAWAARRDACCFHVNHLPTEQRVRQSCGWQVLMLQQYERAGLGAFHRCVTTMRLRRLCVAGGSGFAGPLTCRNC